MMAQDVRVDDADVGDISARLSALEEQLGKVAEVVRDSTHPGMTITIVSPRKPDALAISWIWDGYEIIVQAGRGPGGRWELVPTPAHMDFMEDLVRAIVAGRVRETLGPGRSHVQVTLANGDTPSETGYMGCLPIPGWRRSGRTIEYAASPD